MPIRVILSTSIDEQANAQKYPSAQSPTFLVSTVHIAPIEQCHHLTMTHKCLKNRMHLATAILALTPAFPPSPHHHHSNNERQIQAKVLDDHAYILSSQPPEYDYSYWSTQHER